MVKIKGICVTIAENKNGFIVELSKGKDSFEFSGSRDEIITEILDWGGLPREKIISIVEFICAYKTQPTEIVH